MQRITDATQLVNDEMTFVAFLETLRDDWIANGNTWENPAFDSYFDAAASWSEDSRNAPMLGKPSENPWRRCAEILRAGTRYE